MRRFLAMVGISTVILSLVVASVRAQTAAPTPAPAGPGAAATQKHIEGPVKKVDPAARTVQVGWFLGLFRTSLEVTDDTYIEADGMKGSLADIREGANVKASYEVRDGKNLARWIEVIPGREAERSGSPRPTPAPPADPAEFPDRPAAPLPRS